MKIILIKNYKRQVLIKFIVYYIKKSGIISF
jgi:hypothetical protein